MLIDENPYHLLTATSDGKESNLNSTSGGHCEDGVNKTVYMKIEVYVCKSTNQLQGNGQKRHVIQYELMIRLFIFSFNSNTQIILKTY